MPDTLTFLHTSPIHITTFDAQIKDQAPDIPVAHFVGEDVLTEAHESGISAALNQHTHNKVFAVIDDGAGIVLCTCSSTVDSAEGADGLAPFSAICVDRPMVEITVSIATPIIIAAALKSTIVPTIELIFDATARVEKKLSGSKSSAKKPGHTSKRKTNSPILRKSQSACDKSQTWAKASSSPSPQWPGPPLPAPTDQYRY